MGSEVWLTDAELQQEVWAGESRWAHCAPWPYSPAYSVGNITHIYTFFNHEMIVLIQTAYLNIPQTIIQYIHI